MVLVAAFLWEICSSNLVVDCFIEGGSGGAMRVEQTLNCSGGSMVISACKATKAGGAIFLKSAHVTGDAKLTFQNCSAKSGGAVRVIGEGWSQLGGRARFENCHAGVLARGQFGALAGAARGGGAISIRVGNVTQVAGHLDFYGCLGAKGGAIYINEGHMILQGGSQDYVDCDSRTGGGGVFLHKGNFYQEKTNLTFLRCKAHRKGGAVDVSQGSYYQGAEASLNITQCYATDHGGGLFASGSLDLSDVDFHENFAYGSGMAAIARDHLVLRSMRFEGLGESVLTAPKVRADWVSCLGSQQCRLRGRDVQVKEFRCPRGTGRYKGRLTEGCLPCATGMVQILEDANVSCAACPSNALCSAQYLRAFPGYMVSRDNISRTYHCPNSMACLGGDFPNETKAMCRSGYTGLGCVQCETTHGKSDEDILRCAQCSKERWLQALQISWLIVKDAIVFGIAGASLLGDAIEQKHSNILLNQFMAFAVVAGSTLSSTMNTKTVRIWSSQNLGSFWSELLQYDGGSSLECILGYMGLPKTVWGSHLISSITPALLMLLFAVVKDLPSALIVGSNCFLPRFWGDLGRFFVCYRIEPEGEGGQQICPFLPPQPWLWLFFFLLLFVLVIYAWHHTVHASADERHRAHVIYLIRGYQPQYASLELERLVRKMFLRLFTALLPVTLFPALHMAGDTLVLLFAWILHLHLAPYQKAKWNWTEAFLLTTALLMTILSNCMIANDSHWGHSVLTQYILFVVILSLMFGSSLLMAGAFLVQVHHERFATQKGGDEDVRDRKSVV